MTHLTRRRFLAAAGAALAAPAGAYFYAREIEPHWLQIVRRELPVTGLPATLEGRLLVQLSDLHVGRVEADFLRRAFAAAAELRPDIVAVTGDWISYRGPEELRELAALLPALPRGSLATVGVLGNHDYGHDWNMPAVGEEVARLAEDAGVRMLRNEKLDVEGLRILGVDDLWGPHFGPGELMKRHGGEPASLALCHNPDAADRDVWHGFGGWILAGHTHGGQCRPPFLPPPILPVENRRYTAGAFDLAGGRRLYINRGIGHLLKARFNVRPEITAATLVRA